MIRLKPETNLTPVDGDNRDDDFTASDVDALANLAA